ncbi:MAG: glycosyltransferase family 39 protein [Alphaproteobacteria bacterium]|nr:glycosyltransferase family 39 protein [Alphaproteobacteria bacterium]
MLAFKAQNKRLNLLLCSIIGINVLFVLWTLFYSAIIVCDDIEHLRAAYFVSIGDVPYRDFFEHHHPLLWYVLWPLIKILPHSTIWNIYIGRALSLLVSFGTGYYFYQIMRRFIGGKTVALLAIVLYFASMPAWASLINIKPDIYMRLFYFMGLYYLFSYFRYQKRRDLCICGVAWTFGFLFLQTITLDVLPLVLPVGWFIYKNPVKIKDFVVAAILPLLLLMAFCGVLYYGGAWETYFESNWLFNNRLSNFLSSQSQRKYLVLFADIIFMAFAGVIYYLQRSRKTKIYVASLILLCGWELLQRVFWVALFSQYFIMFFAFAAMIIAPLLYKVLRRYPFSIYLFIIFVILHILFNWLCKRPFVFSEQAFYYLEKNNVPLEQTYGLNCTIYQPHKTYYWMLLDVETLHDIYYNRGTNYDINRLLSDENIRFYCNPSFRNSIILQEKLEKMYDLTAAQKEILLRHKIDNVFFEQNYHPIENTKGLFEKKSAAANSDNH